MNKNFWLATALAVVGAVPHAQELPANDYNPGAKFNPEISAQSLIAFRKNIGQWEDHILFQGANRDAAFYLMKEGVSFSSTRVMEGGNDDNRRVLVWNIMFDGANADAAVTTTGDRNSKWNYMIGNDRSKWAFDVPDVSSVTYHNLYENIDLKYYSHGRNLKYDFIVKNGAKARDIRLRGEGIERIEINRKGELEITTPWGTLVEDAPYSYQLIDGKRVEVDVSYELKDDLTYGFKVYGDYQKDHELVIDPVILNYCTYVAGNAGWSYVHESDINEKGELYGTGYAVSNFPTVAGSYDTGYNGGTNDVFVYKMNRTGTDLVWGTYVGGTQFETGRSIQLNSKDEPVVVATSGSTGYFPTTPASFPITPGAYRDGGGGGTNSVIFRLSEDGKQLLASSVLPGRKAMGLTLNENDEVFITGLTKWNSFETTPGAPSTGTIFVTKMDPDFKTLIYSSKCNGGTNSLGQEVIVNAADEAIVVGRCENQFKAVGNVYQNSHGGILDGFIMRLNADGTIQKATFLGGTGSDYAWAIDMDANENYYVTGSAGNNFPVTSGVYDDTWEVNGLGGTEVFVLKIDKALKNLAWSTYIGGDDYGGVSASGGPGQVGTSIKVNTFGDIFVAGYSWTNDFPTTANCDNKWMNHIGEHMSFIFRMTNDGTTLRYSKAITGSSYDYGGTSDARHSLHILEDECGGTEAFVTLSTHSYDFDVQTRSGAAPYQSIPPDDVDQTIAYNLKPVIEPDFEFTTPQCNVGVQFTDQTSGNCVELWTIPNWAPTGWYWEFGDGGVSTEQNPSHVFAKPGTYEVKLTVTCPEDSIIKTVVVPGPFADLDLGPDLVSCPGNVNSTLDPGPQPAGTTYLWSDGSTTSTINATQTGTYWVQVSDGICIASDTIEIRFENITGSVDVVDVTCKGGNDGSITANPTGGTPPYTYSWSNSQTGQVATGLAAGSYTVTVRDINGCEIQAPITVDEPTTSVGVTTSATGVSCNAQNGSVTAAASGGTGNYTYSWTDGTITASGATVNNLPAGTYTVTVTDGNGCTATEVAVVDQDPPIITGAITFQQDAGCNTDDGIATVTPSGGAAPYTYLWNDPLGQTTRTANNLPQGTYTVTITDKDGCSGDVTVEIKGGGGLTLETTELTADSCDRFGGLQATATVTASGGQSPYTYQWDDANNQTTETAIGLDVGTYNVVVTDNNGCNSSTTVEIQEKIQLTTVIDADASCSTCADGKLVVNVAGSGTAPYTYRWSPNDETTKAISGLSPGEYIVTVTDAKGCSNRDTVRLGVFGVEDYNALDNAISVHPNPSRGQFNINIAGATLYKNLQVNIYDVQGKVILTQSLNDQGAFKLNIENESEGLYLMEFISDGLRSVKRVSLLK